MNRLIDWLQRNREVMLLVISALLLPLLTELAASLIQLSIGESPDRLLTALAVGGLLALVLWVVYRLLGEKPPPKLIPLEDQPARHAGLIVLVGPGREGDDPKNLSHHPAIEYHLDEERAGGDPLQVCWLLATPGKQGSMPVAREVRKRYSDRCQLVIKTVYNYLGVQDTYDIVRTIYAEEAKGVGLAPDQVIADFTGATKPMSAGMVLACQDRWPMQYMSGKPGQIPSQPIAVRFSSA